MSPAVVLRCPVAAVSVLLICFSLLLATVQGSALLQPMHDRNALASIPGDSAFDQRWDDPIPGTKAFAGFQQRGVIDLSKRDCLPNGTNFCFGDSVNFCASCGTCCVDGIYCCGEGGICCGTGCCASGQTCDQGKCLSSAAPITVTAISYQTVTRTVTQVATVVVVVVDTSTVVRETETTVSNEETQTNIIWVTETVLARRALATAEVRRDVRRDDDDAPLPRHSWASAWRAAWGSIVPRGNLPHIVHDAPQAAPLQRRQATRAPGTVEPVPTVTVFVTQTVESTMVISETITTQSTSMVMTTVTRTNTRVLNARTTIDVTSVLTITNHEPVTQVITTTQSPIPTAPTTQAPRTSSPSSSPTNLPVVSKSSSIKTPAIVGIAIGGIAAAAIVAAIVIFWFRYRRKRDQNDNPNADLPANVNDLDMMREPTYPALKHFVSQRASAHHSAQFHPPPGGMAGLAAAAGVVHNDSDDPHKSSGGSSPLTPENRTSSVYSSAYNTLVGTPGAGQPRDRVSAMTTASGYAAALGSEWADDDGLARTNSVSPVVTVGAGGRGSRRLSQQQVQQLQQIQQQQFQQLQQQQQQYQQQQQQQLPRRSSRQHSQSFGSQHQYQPPPPPVPPPPEELDSTPVLEIGPGRGAEPSTPPLIPPRLRPTPQQGQGQGQHLRVVNGDGDGGGPMYDGASWGDPNSPGLQSATLVGRSPEPGVGRGR